MAGNNFLLDTVMVAAYFNQEAVLRQKLQGISIYVSSITIGELYFGAYNSQRVADNIQQIRDFVVLTPVLLCNHVTGDYYGQIKRALKAKGRPIPENDVWIAATALQYDLTLISRDGHFKEIDALKLEVW